MRALGYFVAAFTLVLVLTAPALARVAMIETAAPIKDKSEDSVKAALKEAVDTAAKGAVAMGLPWVQLRDAQVLEDAVAIQVVATDQAPEQTTKSHDNGTPGASQGPDSGKDLGAVPGQSPQPGQPHRAQPSPPDGTANF